MKLTYLVILFLYSQMATGALKAKWPFGPWEKKDPEQAGLSYLKLYDVQKYVFAKDQDYQTNALLIVRNGRLVFERYENGYTYENPQRLWSISKSVTNAVVGAAIQGGFVRLRDLVAVNYPQMAQDKWAKKVTLKDLLRMSSGLNWNEGYENAILNSDVLKMLYGNGRQDVAQFVSSHPAKCQPGVCFNYSSGETNLIMGYLKNVLGKKNYDLFPWTNLFYKVGITSATWEQDPSGTFIGSSYLYMRPRDLAKIGLLYLRNGKAEDKQVLPQKFVSWSLQLAPAFNKTFLEHENEHSFGAHWWLNKPAPFKKTPKPYPDLPETAFFALGHWGQVLAIIPSHNMVIVRHGNDRKGKIDINKMVSLVLKSMERDPIKPAKNEK